MNQVQKFAFGLMDLRVIELEGQPWFVAKDVFETLGYPKGSRTYQLLQLGKDEVMVLEIQTVKTGTKAINESGLYKLVMRSDKPEAKAFQDWVTRVVLPAIRKDGAYVLGEEKVVTGEISEDELILRAMQAQQKKVDRLVLERDRLQAHNLLLQKEKMHLEDYNQRILPAAEVGQAVGQRARIGVVDFCRKLPGVNTMQVQKDLMVLQYLFKREGHWAVRHKFKGALFDEVLAPDGRSKIVVLEKGQQLLVSLYHDNRLTMKAGCKPLARIDLELPHPRPIEEGYDVELEN